jgi:MarR family transcriptional regulator, organic hydroperoxide resistance regulator
MSPTQRVWLPPHSTLARHTAYLAIQLGAEMRKVVDLELRELGLTWPDFLVLAITSALDGAAQEAIHDRAGVDRGSLSRLVREFEDEGLIERHRGRSDGRRVLCEATPVGVAVAGEGASAVDQASRKLLRRLRARNARGLGATARPA